MKVLLIFLFSVSTLASIDTHYDDAQKQWFDTANEFEKTLVYTSKAEIFLRDLSATDQFRSRISQIENDLKTDVRKTLAFVEKYLETKADKISLDDDLIMRLAQLYYKDANYRLQENMESYHDKLTAHYADRSKKAPKIPKPDFSKTLQYSKMLLDRFPRSAFASYAWYIMGAIEEENGNYEGALKSYQVVVNQFPFSKHRSESLWRAAELHFDFTQWKQAVPLYEELVESKNTDYSAKSLYKLGAIQYSQDKLKKAKQSFVRLLAQLESSRDSSLSVSLMSEVHEYLGLLHFRGVSIQDLPDEQELASLKSVGQRLERHNQYSEARSVYRNYITKNYFNPQVPIYYGLLIKSLEADGKINQSLNHRERLLSHIRKGGPWWKKNSDSEAKYTAEQISTENKFFLAKHFAAVGFEKYSVSDLRKSEKLFVDYIKLANDQQLGEVYFELAQVQNRLDKKRSAINSFNKALDAGLSPVDRPRAASEVFQTQLELASYKLQNISSRSLQAKPVELDSKEIVISKIYQKVEPELRGSEYELPIAFFMAQMYLSRSKLVEAKQIFKKIISNQDVSPAQITYLEDSAKWLTEIYASNKQWDKISEVNNKLKNAGASDGFTNSNLAKARFNNSLLAEAEVKEETGDLMGAALSFLSFSEKNSKHFESERAKFKAAYLFREAGSYQKSNLALKDIFKTEYRKESLRMYTQNLLDSLQFEKARKFVSGLPKSDLRKDRSLAAVIELTTFLGESSSLADRFAAQYKENEKPEFGVRAAKEYIYSGEHKKALALIKELEKRKIRPLEIKGLRILSAWVDMNSKVALEQCSSLRDSYVKLKKVTEFEQNLSLICSNLAEYNQTNTVSKESLDANLSEKAWEAYVFGKLLTINRNTNVKSIVDLSNMKALAISNYIPNITSKLGMHKFTNFELFPFDIAKDRFISWRPLVRSDKAFDYQSFCEKVGFGVCYKKLQSSGEKSKKYEYDLLVKLALILDRQSEAISWVEMAKQESKLSGLESLIDWNESAEYSVSYLGKEIFEGRGNLNHYLQAASYFYKTKQYKKSNYTIKRISKRFSDDNLAQKIYSYLSGKESEVGFDVVSDPRIWFLQKLSGVSGEQKYLPKKRLLIGSEWYKSIALVRSIKRGSRAPKLRKSASAYYRVLAAMKFYQQGDYEKQEQLFGQAKELSPSIVDLSPVNKNFRGVASEAK